MIKRWVFLNFGLLAITALLSWYLIGAVADFNDDNDLARIQPARDLRKSAGDEVIPAARPQSPHNPSDFQVISAQNLFSETRTKEEKSEAVTVLEVPPMTVKPVLVGVTAMGDRRLALIVDPASQGGGRKTQTKRLGDTYQGYTITDITENQMVLESGARREVIPLFDGSKRPTQGGKTQITMTRVVPFGGGGAGSGGAAVVQPQRIQTGTAVQARQAAAQVQQAVPGAAPGAQAAPAAPQSGIVRTGPLQQGRQVPGSPQGPTWNESVDDQGRRVIRTPFGDIVRDRPPNR